MTFIALTIALGWVLVYIGHEYVVPNAKKPILIAISDPSVHGLIALLLVLPFYFFEVIDLKTFAISILLAVFIDIDHIVAAKSFDLKAMLSLPTRPISHSILFSLIMSSVAVLVLKYFANSPNSTILLVYIFFISLVSHVMRDAIESSITPWAFPIYSPPIGKLIFFIGFISLNYLHLIYSLAIKK